MTQKKKKELVKKPMPSHQAEKVRKIAVAVAKNPEATIREIAKDTGIAKSTVGDNIGHIGRIKEDWLEELLSVDIEIVKSATKEIHRRINSEEERKKIKATDLSSIAKDSTARYSAFRGSVTDEKGGLKEIDWLNAPLEDLLKLIKK